VFCLVANAEIAKFYCLAHHLHGAKVIKTFKSK
jgi:hypothetical protein